MSDSTTFLQGTAPQVLPGRERRATVRYACEQDALCYFRTVGKYACRWAQVRDISRAGVGLLVGCSFTPGKAVLLRLVDSSAASERALLARVVHSEPQDDGSWLVGCSFERALSEEEVRALLQESGRHSALPASAPGRG